MGDSRRDGRLPRRRHRGRLLGGDGRQPDSDGARRGPLRGQSGRQRGPLRSGVLGLVRHRDLRHQHRRSQHHARLNDAAGWHGPDVQPSCRLHLARRRRRRALRLPRRRDHRGVRRGADGRPHAGISRQEDRGARDEVRHAGGADLSAERPRIYGRLGAAADGARQHEQQRSAWPFGSHLSLRLEQRQQRLSFRRDQRQYALVQHDGRPRHAARPLRLCRAGAGARRLARGEEECSGLGRHVPDRRPAVRRAAWSA